MIQQPRNIDCDVKHKPIFCGYRCGIKPPPEIVEHHCYVVRVYRRTSNGKWFYTVAKDGVRLRESGPYDEKPEILHSVALK